ncbi:MAG TPA: radical SAM protein [Bacillota bacterium]|nr:radical SAM protein [Bacillota bacterium]
MNLLLLRPYYGVNVHGDMHGDLGIADYSPEIFPDLSLVFAATIGKKNQDVKLCVIDANAEKLFPSQVIKKINKETESIIFKATAPTIKLDLEFAKQLKTYFPETKLIMSGHIAKLLKKWIQTNVPEIDEVVEIPVENYITELINGKGSYTGINHFPSPDYTLMPYEKYLNADGELRGCLYMSRGCPTGCTYCPYTSFYQKSVEFRSPENVIEDIKGLLKLGIKMVHFRDQYFTLNKKNVVNLCRMIIDQKLDIKWRCETKIESLSTDLIDLMVEAGLEMISFGIESASDETLESYQRPVNKLDKAKEFTRYLNQKNVKTLAFYIIGFPNDTWENIQATYHLATEINSTYAKFSIFSQCISDDPNQELSPEDFTPFENTMVLNPSKNLSQEELRYLSNYLMLSYHSETNGMKNAYKFHYINQLRLDEFLKNVQNYMRNRSVMEIKEKIS